MKHCSVCKKLKLKIEFNARKSSKDGLQYHCSECTKTRLKSFHNKKMESLTGHIKTILTRIKSRAKQTKIDFDLSVEYLESIVVTNCPILDVDLTWCKKSGKPTNNSPSLDRLNPKLGYIKGNVAWVSYRANRIKQDANLVELKKLINWMENQWKIFLAKFWKELKMLKKSLRGW